MFGYYLRKIGNGLISLFIFITILFFVAQVIIPHDFTTQFALSMNRGLREELQHQLGLDLPLWQQYLHWLGRLVSGGFGKSFYGYSISEMLKSVIPPTLLIFLLGTILAFLIGLWLGKVTAWKGRGIFTGVTTFSAIALYTSFPPWLAFLMFYLFVRKLGIFPPILHENPLRALFGNYVKEETITAAQIINTILLTLLASAVIVWGANILIHKVFRKKIHPILFFVLVVSLWVGSWFILGIDEIAIQIMRLAGVPLITYVFLSLGETMLITQTAMRDTLHEEYIQTARAKGLPEAVIRNKHAARNAIIPVLSRLLVSLPYLLTGIVIIEKAVQWPGMGSTLFMALYQQDMPVVLAVLLIVGFVSLIARFILEIISLALDPRLRDRTFLAQQEQNALQQRA
ncbi:MAG: ABC transporter permease [Anaerolineales bacterium]|nr:ABC transporter permease [Anaerolineales bacterium]